MARISVTTLEIGSGTASVTSVAFRPQDLNLGWQVLIADTTTATVRLQVSNNGTSWRTISTLTATDFIETTGPFRQIRVTTESASGASIAIIVSSARPLEAV